jgi:predicted transcriptional regulator of viral defense system
MEFERFLEIIGDEPVFKTSLLLAGDVDPFDVHRQLTRWTSAGKLIQVRRGIYCLAPPYQKVNPHPFLVANHMQPGSYVSLQSALSFHGMIPEGVPVTTSVTTCRPGDFATQLGQFHFQHIQVGWFTGYEVLQLGSGQSAFVATPEKALLDLIYLQPGGDAAAFLRSLRLQALGKINIERIKQYIQSVSKPKLDRALRTIRQMMDEEREFEDL